MIIRCIVGLKCLPSSLNGALDELQKSAFPGNISLEAAARERSLTK
jgi:hypothetical protein